MHSTNITVIKSCRWVKVSVPMKKYKSLRGFSVSVQCSSSISKNLWHNSFKKPCTFEEITAEENRAREDSSKNVRFLCHEEFFMFSTDFKGNKNVM